MAGLWQQAQPLVSCAGRAAARKQTFLPTVLERNTMALPAVTAFLCLLGGLDGSKTRTEVFGDFCELAYAALRGVAGRVICGNALSAERFEMAYTPAAAGFIPRHGHPFISNNAAACDRSVRVRKKSDLTAGLEAQHFDAMS